MQLFSAKIQVSAYTLNYSNFKNKFLFNNGSILEINDYYNNRNRGNVSLTELCNNKYSIKSRFAGLDKFRLRTSLGQIKEMRIKMN